MKLSSLNLQDIPVDLTSTEVNIRDTEIKIRNIETELYNMNECEDMTVRKFRYCFFPT